jgi:hypothetical protein
MTKLEQIEAEDASYESDDDLRALTGVAMAVGAEAVKHRRYLLSLVREMEGALRGMMLSADASWVENGLGGHDWRQAYGGARIALARLSEPEEPPCP